MGILHIPLRLTMADAPETKTEQMKLGPGLVFKAMERFGFPTVVAIAIGSAFYMYAKQVHEERLAGDAKIVAKLNKVLILLEVKNGCSLLNSQDLFEKDVVEKVEAK
jgi:hypothetical protein